MPHFLCRFLDPAGQVEADIPIVVSTEGEAVARAWELFKHRGAQGAFDVMDGTRRIAHGPPQPTPAPVRPSQTEGA